MIKVINVPADTPKEEIEEMKKNLDNNTVLHFDYTDENLVLDINKK